MSERLKDILHSARKAELFVLVILVALAGLCLLNSDDNMGAANDTSTEARLESILSCIDGVRKPRVMISYGGDGGVVGVVVVAGGVSHMETRLNVQSAVQTLLNVELSRIEIIDRN